MDALYAASTQAFEPVFSKTLQLPVAATLITSGTDPNCDSIRTRLSETDEGANEGIGLLATGFFSVSKNPAATLGSAVVASTALG